MISTAPVALWREPGMTGLFLELLFAAPRNRPWVRSDKAEQYRGVGVQLLRTAVALSMEAGCGGRLKLEASPGSVDWYRNRGLLDTAEERIVHEGVTYAPMELEADRIWSLFPEKGAQRGHKD